MWPSWRIKHSWHCVVCKTYCTGTPNKEIDPLSILHVELPHIIQKLTSHVDSSIYDHVLATHCRSMTSSLLDDESCMACSQLRPVFGLWIIDTSIVKAISDFSLLVVAFFSSKDYELMLLVNNRWMSKAAKFWQVSCVRDWLPKATLWVELWNIILDFSCPPSIHQCISIHHNNGCTFPYLRLSIIAQEFIPVKLYELIRFASFLLFEFLFQLWLLKNISRYYIELRILMNHQIRVIHSFKLLFHRVDQPTVILSLN